MAKLISPRREETQLGKAKDYIRTHILFPSALLGMILLLAATMALAYQYLVETYDGQTFFQSTGLAFLGAFAGWGQSRYHRYLLTEAPDYLASRLRAFEKKDQSRARKDWPIIEAQHRGRQWVPLWYVLGACMFLGMSFWASAWGSVYAVAGYLLPWAGFYCARVYAWKDLWGPTKTPGSKT